MSNFSAITATLPRLPKWAHIMEGQPRAIVTALALDGSATALHKGIAPVADISLFPHMFDTVIEQVGKMASRPCISMAVVWVVPDSYREAIVPLTELLEESLFQIGVGFDGSYFADSLSQGTAVEGFDGDTMGHCGSNRSCKAETRWDMHDLLLLPSTATSEEMEQVQAIADTVNIAPSERDCHLDKPLPKAVVDCYTTYMDILNGLDSQPCTEEVIEYLLAKPERTRCAVEVCKYVQMRDVALAPLFDEDFNERQLAFWSACASLFTGNMRANAYAALTVKAIVNEDMDMATRAMRLSYCSDKDNSLTGLLAIAITNDIAPKAVKSLKDATNDLVAKAK